MELALSPVYSSWDRDRLRDFYLKEVINLDVSAVYIGEVICQKRSALNEEDYKEIISTLKDHGKTVYLSTLALITNNYELGETKKYAHLFDGIEVNSFGVLNLIIKDDALKDKDIIIGPFMNIYNSFSANYLKKFNPKRFIPPYEIPLDTIKEIAEKSEVALEVFSWGHLSTALSWRCYSARMHNLNRENCMEKCFENPDGVLLKTMDNEDLFIIGGTQVLSSKTHCAIEEIDTFKEVGISYLRLTPFYKNTADVIRIFRGVINKEIDKKEAVEMLGEHAPHGLSNGWLQGKPGWEYVTT